MIMEMLKFNWRTTKTYRLELFIMPPTLLFFGVLSPSIFVFPYATIIITSVTLGFFLIEKKDAATIFLCLPVKRSQIVLGKYVFSLVLLAANFLLCIIILPIVNLIKVDKWNTHFEFVLSAVLMCFLIYAILNLLYYPISMWIGVVGSITYIYIIIVPVIIIGAFAGYVVVLYEENILRFFTFAAENPLSVNGPIFILAMLLLLFSYALSIKIYENKDF